jgi:hypothetical protein
LAGFFRKFFGTEKTSGKKILLMGDRNMFDRKSGIMMMQKQHAQA